VATGFHSACTRPNVFSSARSAATPRWLPASISDSGNEARTIAVGTSFAASVSACTNDRLLSYVPPLRVAALGELANVGDQLVDEDDARRVRFEQRAQHVLAGRGAGASASRTSA
jgi:hypothetical protein